ncbi:hypothetical protein, partial [Aliiroseovarius sp. YM-037]|uniref:hypothetical protein n=1 Tax=Aliiroseovarius sp. YM-037 TaxID=3341728 RepID=UPI003A80EBC9
PHGVLPCKNADLPENHQPKRQLFRRNNERVLGLLRASAHGFAGDKKRFLASGGDIFKKVVRG